MTRILLTIDFDFFVRLLHEYDWQHNESHGDSIQQAVWMTRAAQLLGSGIDPASMLVGDPSALPADLGARGLRLRGASLFVADSHAWGGPWAMQNGSRGTSLVNLDAHHDLGYWEREALAKMLREQRVECGSWARAALLLNACRDYRVIYPAWKGLAELRDAKHPRTHLTARQLARCSFAEWPSAGPIEGKAASVLLVRSGAWSPPWLDGAWLGMVAAFASATRRLPEMLGDRDVSRPRAFLMDAAKRHAQLFEMMRRGEHLPAETAQGNLVERGVEPAER